MAWLERKQYSEEQLSRNYRRAYRIVRPLFRLFFPNRVIGRERIVFPLPPHPILSICSVL